MINKKIKDLIKKNPEPARGTVGVNPSDPWSAKANIAEDSSLNQYLLARGINPKFVSRETKISHAKSSTFQKWKSDRKFEEVETEEPLVEDAMLDKFLMSRGINPNHVPPNIKVSYAKSGAFIKWKENHMHEETKPTELDKFRKASDERQKKHNEIQNKQSKDGSGMTSAIDRLEKHLNKEEVERVEENHIAIAMGKMLDDESGMVLSQIEELERACTMVRSYIGKDYEKQLPAWVQAKVTLATDYMSTVGNYLVSKNEKVNEDVEQIDELKKDTLKSYRDKSMASIKNARKNREASEAGMHMSKGFADLHAKSDAIAKKRAKGLSGYLQRKHGMKPGYDDERKTTSEDVFQDPQAATQTCFDGGNNTDDTSNKKKEMSKSARMIKSLYKQHNMKEDTYDWEKDDKNQTSYGKKPKVIKDDEKSPTTKQPEARAVLTGGTTLTGDGRDTLEIDPMMKNRPDLNGNMKDNIGDNSKKKNKINN